MPKVSYLYTLDLDSVNNAITEMNNSLERVETTQPAASAPPPASGLIIDESIGDSETEVIADTLNLEDGIYHIEAVFVLKGAQSIKMYFNGDETAANYATYDNFGSTAGGISAGTAADNRLCVVTADSLVYYSGDMYVALGDNGLKQKQVLIKGDWGRTHDGVSFNSFCRIAASVTVPEDNINKIKIISTVAKGMVKGTKIKMWRVM